MLRRQFINFLLFFFIFSLILFCNHHLSLFLICKLILFALLFLIHTLYIHVLYSLVKHIMKGEFLYIILNLTQACSYCYQPDLIQSQLLFTSVCILKELVDILSIGGCSVLSLISVDHFLVSFHRISNYKISYVN